MQVDTRFEEGSESLSDRYYEHKHIFQYDPSKRKPPIRIQVKTKKHCFYKAGQYCGHYSVI